MDNREIILDVKKLNTTFVSDRRKVRIVKDVSFQVKRGQICLNLLDIRLELSGSGI